MARTELKERDRQCHRKGRGRTRTEPKEREDGQCHRKGRGTKGHAVLEEKGDARKVAEERERYDARIVPEEWGETKTVPTERECNAGAEQ